MRLDLHIHTTLGSACSVMTPDDLMKAALEAKLDGVCITEHNRIWTPEQADELSQRYGLAVFRGIEITTTGGDILVFGFDQEPEGMLTPEQLKTGVDSAGAVAIAAHPFRGFLLFGFGMLQMSVEDARDNPTFSQVHGLEICNGKVTDDENEFARQVADMMGLIKLGGSDAHDVEAVGTCVTVFESDIKSDVDLAQAIMSGQYYLERCK
ncbi:MAG: PHP domain-containing protein [Syntrophaceae bacterium]|nr:PHP domain-containing protein [Syntrophaceae bacterium]